MTPTGGPNWPLETGDALSAAFDLYRRNAVKLWTIAAAVLIPIEILVIILERVQASTASATGGVALLVVWVFHLLGILLVNGAVFYLLLGELTGRSVEVDEAFARAWPRLGSLFVLGILLTLMILIGFILLIIPGVYLLVATSVAIPALMLEGVGGTEAIGRSMTLVSNRWWATFGTLLVAFILYFVAALVLGAIGGAIAGGTSSLTLYFIIVGIVNVIGYILFAPFWAAVVSVIYIDLRVRKEGVTPSTLLTGSAAPAAPAPAAPPTAAPGGPAAGGSPQPPSTPPPSSTPPPPSGPPPADPGAGPPGSSPPPPAGGM